MKKELFEKLKQDDRIEYLLHDNDLNNQKRFYIIIESVCILVVGLIIIGEYLVKGMMATPAVVIGCVAGFIVIILSFVCSLVLIPHLKRRLSDHFMQRLEVKAK